MHHSVIPGFPKTTDTSDDDDNVNAQQAPVRYSFFGAPTSQPVVSLTARVSPAAGLITSASVAERPFAPASGERASVSLASITPAPATSGPAVANAITGTPVTSDSGDQALMGPQARAQFHVDGTGVRIGIISDSINYFGNVATDQANNDLPADLNILNDPAGGTDEGRGLGNIIHRVAPGAAIDFYGIASNDQNFDADYAKAVAALRAAGDKIIVDDLGSTAEPFYSLGTQADNAITAATSAGVSVFSSAGNEGTQFFEQPWQSFTTSLAAEGGPVRASAYNFGTSAAPNALQSITIPTGLTINLDLQWNQPFASITGSTGATGTLGLYLFDTVTNTLVSSALFDDRGGDPIQFLRYNNTSADTSFALAITLLNGKAPTLFKYIVVDNRIPDVTINDPRVGQGSGSVFGHALAPGDIAVAAAGAPSINAGAPAIEGFSGAGDATLQFGANGQKLATPQTVVAPAITAPDDINTAWRSDFFGTSAAAPGAAAVAALLLQRDPSLTPARVATALTSTATPIPGVSATRQGAGLINAAAALASVQCFAEGTRILTATGEMPVEAIQPGMVLPTATGRARRVTWVGHRTIHLATHPAPDFVQPVRVRANAIGPGVPSRDTWLSPDHALWIDGALVPVRLLLNGVSIARDDRARVTYWHIALDRHAAIVANGMAAESLADAKRRDFAGGAVTTLHPVFDTPAARRFAPLATGAATTRPIWQRLADRAGAPPPPAAVPAAWRVYARDTALTPVIIHGARRVFALPPRADRVVLRSAAEAPSAILPWVDDRRRLGVACGRVAFDSVPVALDHPCLEQGFWPLEPGTLPVRWTDGHAVIRVPQGARLFELTIRATARCRPEAAAPAAATHP